jgi:hypothetical protein
MSTSPLIETEALDQRLIEDPTWHLDLPLLSGNATSTIIYDLRYPANARPVLTSEKGTKTPSANPTTQDKP